MSALGQTPPASSASQSAADAPPFGIVAVIGLGLMGGSLVRALRALSPAPEVIGFSPDASERAAALEARVLDLAAAHAEEAAAQADLIVYATPLAATVELMSRHRGAWRPEAVVSDVCSLKSATWTSARSLGVEHRYVGAHPMTGGEASGFAASRPDLYRDAPVWLVGPAAAGAARARVERFWRALGASPAWIDPEAHDRLMVHVSHLPQLISNLLADALRRSGIGPGDLGPGGRDMTRLSGSSPEIWRDLLTSSAPELAPALRELASALEEAAASLEGKDFDTVVEMMARTRAWRSGGVSASGGPRIEGA